MNKLHGQYIYFKTPWLIQSHNLESVEKVSSTLDLIESIALVLGISNILYDKQRPKLKLVVDNTLNKANTLLIK